MKIINIIITFLFISQTLWALGVNTNNSESSKKIEKEKKIVIIGDSLTEGLGVNKEDNYISLIQKKISQDKLALKIINGSISGSTTSSLVSRIKWFMKTRPDIMIFSLGANDGLRGIDTKVISANLEEGIKLVKDENVDLYIMEMKMPPNYGEKYQRDFENIYKNLAKKYHIKLIPFLLQNVAGKKELNQSDGIHPNEEGHRIIAEELYPVFKKLIN